MIYGVSHFIFFVLFTALLLLVYLLGALAGRYRQHQGSAPGSGLLVEGTLLSLLIGFTFGMAQNNFQKRRELIDQEINDFSTMSTYLKLYPDSTMLPVQQQMKVLLAERLRYYKAGNDEHAVAISFGHTDSLARLVEAKVLQRCRDTRFQANNLMLVPAMNALFDGYASSELYRTAKVPLAVMKMLFLLSLVVSFINGYDQAKTKTSWVVVIGFALLISMTFYMILDLGDARSGNINLKREIGLLEQQVRNCNP